MREKQKKLKEARKVADNQVEKYKNKLEEEFEDKKRIQFGDMDDQEEIEAETQEEISKIQQDYEDHKDDVVDFLIENVMNVNLEIPRVVRGDFENF
eukprot:CAMPEP_0205804020 /NCGR_PEP_ID=MMETSP0205-20121125/6792_1 /ASSEMBLY_ACC=CAM_ASM_000278 /TAXON_ID=36767 /ORGANISM="Euplotes focardii, Strain TN1" /LENGTH=95 /DNA_ID=CAMNT_0053072917 /DNA_START=91 /DNA_END=378 /DNA_ORIENTATION=-